MTMQTVAACDRCGRGYSYIHHDGVECIARDGGRVWYLPQFEDGILDDNWTRCRRQKIVSEMYRMEEVTHAD